MRLPFLSTGTRLLAITALASLSGCTTLSSPYSQGKITPITASTNWQFESGSSITANPNGGGGFLMGSMQIQGSQVTGTFQTQVTCVDVPQPVTFTGTYNPTTGALNVKPTGPAFVDVNVVVPADPTQMASGTIGGGGNVCTIAFQGPGVGIEVPTLTGTYTGTISDTEPTPAPGIQPGTATLNLTQSTTANANAAFPLTGTLQFTSSTCNTSIPVAGTINGVSFTLTSTNSTAVTITGADASGGATLTTVTALFPSGLCNAFAATYTGTLILQ